jgi:hypothetical protein
MDNGSVVEAAAIPEDIVLPTVEDSRSWKRCGRGSTAQGSGGARRRLAKRGDDQSKPTIQA